MGETPGRWSRKKYIITGLVVVAAGLYFGYTGFEAFWNGVPIAMPHAPAMEGWLALIYSGLLVVFGLCIIAVGLGWMKTRGPH